MSDSVRPHRWQPTRLRRPWDSPGKNTGVGCHVLLQCMKVKSESEVAQSCLTLTDPMACSLSGSSTHGIFQARTLEWVAIAFTTNSCLILNEVEVVPFSSHFPHLCCSATQSCLTLSDPMDCSLPGSSIHGIFQARVLEWAAISFSSG